MKHTSYYKSGEHRRNVLQAKKLATESIQRRKVQRIDSYNLNPAICVHCSQPLDYRRRRNRFCTKSCAALHNNSARPSGSESRIAQASKLAGRKINGRQPKSIPANKLCKIQWHSCISCQKVFYTRTWSAPKKTCGNKSCQTHASVGSRPYKNGRRKLYTYHNKWDKVNVMLESSWELEVATWLDREDVRWTRPAPIKWTDDLGKPRLYYPDFYLNDIDLYLDPKNPTAMLADSMKMRKVSAMIRIIYGGVEHIKEEVARLLNRV